MAVEIFEKLWERYDSWYDRHAEIFRREVKFLRNYVGNFEKGLEVGVGTGRFAKALGIEYGIDLSKAMLKLAKSRGIEVIKADARHLPFKRIFDLVLFAFTLCFLDSPLKALISAREVLIEGGKVVVCSIPKDSKLGREYMNRKDNPFYSNAKFYSVEEIVGMVERAGFTVISTGFGDVKYGGDLVVVVGER
ncbi:class I SAM-dependent methyltransferase [Archaeoglobus sp.]